ncbi:MAG TPA: LytTR family DNA-binding domain-containing protein [Steroidobacteraceae bacterium]|nr:LytTR family DNA-binding domain-containing protein [Steroidobacteraceae bacterium]
MNPTALRVLIVDDEALARQRLADLLAREQAVEIVGQIDNGDAAVKAIRDLAPDLVFLDVQMPGRTGIDVVREIGATQMPATIFVTAYDQYALTAFDVAAIDYLVKPFDDERFELALSRARRAIELREIGALSTRLRTLLDAPTGTPAAASAAAGRGYLERIAVEMRGQIRVVPVEEIDAITASGPYVELHVGDRTYLVRERMQTLEERLDPQQFARVHRSVIVRLDRIGALLREAGGDYAVRLKNGKQHPVSRSRVDQLQRWIGVLP